MDRVFQVSSIHNYFAFFKLNLSSPPNPHRDNEMLKQTENDVRRLRPEIDFFQRRTPCPLQTEHSGYIRLSQRVNHEFLAAEEAGSRMDKFTDKSVSDDEF